MRFSGVEIETISARQVFSHRGHPGIEAIVTTKNGAQGRAIVTPGTSTGKYEAEFVYDEDEKWRGMGMQKAVKNIKEIIEPELKGLDASNQNKIDKIILSLDDTKNKSAIGANAMASVSAAALKAGAKGSGVSLYKHIGGIMALNLPVIGVLVCAGSSRYGGGERSGTKPTYSLMSYGFDNLSEASHAAWQALVEFYNKIEKQLDNIEISLMDKLIIPSGQIDHDEQIWEIMDETIKSLGYEGKMGIQVDVAAGTYYDREQQSYVGIFSKKNKTKDDLMELYNYMIETYPFIIIEDPFEEDDFESHAFLTKKHNVEIVGDDLYATDLERVKRGADIKATDAILLKVNQIGTITEAFEMVDFAYRNGLGVMPCNSRGEGIAIADYAVGLNTGHLREGGTGDVANRLLEIEEELGNNAKFLGEKGLHLS